MSVLHNNPFLLASGSPTDPTFPVQRSVRLRSSASAYFNRTFTTPTDNKKWTMSMWLKRGSLGGNINIFGSVLTGGYFEFRFNTSDQIYIQNRVSSTNLLVANTTAVFRDPSAWYHIVFVFDSANATAANRNLLYVNNVNVTLSANSGSGDACAFNSSGNTQYIGNSDAYTTFDGYLTEVNFIDGQALTPSAFGGYNSGTGVWEPRAYTGTYGTNGFYLNFQDNSNNTATTIGKDSSGNGNNWTPNGISITAGVTYDSMLDVPTNTNASNANYATFNPLKNTATISNGNLQSINAGASGYYTSYSTMEMTSGKYYWELTAVDDGVNARFTGFGIADPTIALTSIGTTLANTPANNSRGWMQAARSSISVYSTGLYNNGAAVNSTTRATTTGTRIFMVAYDADTGKCWMGYEGTWWTGDPAAGTSQYFTASAPMMPVLIPHNDGSNANLIANINFGQRPFAHTPPTGFNRLNTYNLPTPTIPSGDDFHKVYTYTGNGGGLQVGEIQKPASLFNLDRSLRFRASNSAYLNRTPASAGNQQKFTWSGWVKRGTLTSGLPTLFMGGNTTTDTTLAIFFTATDAIRIAGYNTSFIITNSVYRDPSMWYHIVVAVDTTQATGTNRVKLYVNGSQVTDSTYIAPTLNTSFLVNTAVLHTQGAQTVSWGLNYFDGYMSDVYLIDGQQLSPTDFGAYDGNYYWTPKAYTGTYGTNGFHLEFEDNSAATAAAIGKDTSGNVNNWTPNGISVTAGATYDSMTDVPTQTSTDVANFAVMNPLTANKANAFDGNIRIAGGDRYSNSTIGMTSGKWYAEMTVITVGTESSCGISNDVPGALSYVGSNSSSWGYYSNDGFKYTGASGASYGSTYTTNDVIGIAFDADNGTLTFYKNNTSQGVAYTGLTKGPYYFSVSGRTTGTVNNCAINFGQRPFSYTPPTGFKAINSFNVAEVTGDLESPDFVWIKSRSAATGHALFNSVTGVGKYLSSNATTAETTDVNSLIQFNKNGFLLGNAAIVNTSAATYVASAWKAGGTTVTNTDGTISSQVRANQTAGFSVVTYTGTLTTTPSAGAMPTVGHGLNAVPKLIISKSRNVTGVDSGAWVVFSGLIATDSYLRLNTTAGTASVSGGGGGTMVAPTSTVFSTPYISGSNVNANTYVAYCFSEIAGFSKFGSYTGNGSADGPFVYLGFRPRYVLIKRTDTTSDWWVVDSSRNTSNVVNSILYPDLSATEATGTFYDFLSNGFKCRDSANVNVSGGTYIYAAFAENPTKYSLAR